MARQLSWSDVRGGLVGFAVLVVAAIAVMTFSRVGALHGDTLHIYALASEAPGATPGSEVWLSGQKIGKITRIEFLPAATSDTSRRLLVEMEVLSRYRDAVHADATAQIRSGGSLIGAVVVYLTPGSTRSPAIAEGDTIRVKSSVNIEGAGAQFGKAAANVAPIMSNLGALAAALHETRGTAGAVVNGPMLLRLSQTKIQALHVINRLGAHGTVGLIMQGGLSSRAGRVMAQVDSVKALLASDRTSFGRFRRDSTLMSNVSDIREELTLVQRSLDEPRGTAGRVLHDSAMTIALAGAGKEMTLLMADIKKHPLRYNPF